MSSNRYVVYVQAPGRTNVTALAAYDTNAQARASIRWFFKKLRPKYSFYIFEQPVSRAQELA